MPVHVHNTALYNAAIVYFKFSIDRSKSVIIQLSYNPSPGRSHYNNLLLFYYYFQAHNKIENSFFSSSKKSRLLIIIILDSHKHFAICKELFYPSRTIPLVSNLRGNLDEDLHHTVLVDLQPNISPPVLTNKLKRSEIRFCPVEMSTADITSL